jgi:hypothetical protein
MNMWYVLGLICVIGCLLMLFTQPYLSLVLAVCALLTLGRLFKRVVNSRKV